jgi:hypothetical protein
MLCASHTKGRNDKNYVQFDSIWKMQSALPSAHENSTLGNRVVLGFRAGPISILVMKQNPSYSPNSSG